MRLTFSVAWFYGGCYADQDIGEHLRQVCPAMCDTCTTTSAAARSDALGVALLEVGCYVALLCSRCGCAGGRCGGLGCRGLGRGGHACARRTCGYFCQRRVGFVLVFAGVSWQHRVRL